MALGLESELKLLLFHYVRRIGWQQSASAVVGAKKVRENTSVEEAMGGPSELSIFLLQKLVRT